MAFAACSNENDIVNPKNEPQQPASDGITFTAVFGVKNGTTRALSDPGDGTLTASWEVGEKIAIVFNNQVTRAEVSSVDDEGNATVTATLPSGTPNNQAVLYIYPADCAWNGGLRSGIGEVQTGTLYGQFGLNRYDLAIAEGTLVVDGETAQPNGTVTLVNQFAMCKFQFKDENDQVIRDIAKLVITDLSTTRKITVTTPPSMDYFYVAMNPSNNSIKFDLTTSGGKIYKKISSAHLEAGMFYQPTFKMTLIEREYVDLGLPSGTLWATCNVGAESPEEYGDFFAWGETTQKPNYTWRNYKYAYNFTYIPEEGEEGEAGDAVAFTKYVLQRNSEFYGYDGTSFGFWDELTELMPEDDAATANWAAPWHMPTRTQVDELRVNCTRTWTTLNDVNGILVTGPNGNTIFLPAAGEYNDIREGAGSYGVYWTSSLSADTPDASYLEFRSTGWGWYDTFRYVGFPVRPVRNP